MIVVPDELKGQKYDIRYVSPLARAQRAAEVRAIEDYMNLIMAMSEAKQEILDTVNFDKVGKEVAKLQEIPPSILNDDDAIKKIRKERREQEQEDLKLQQASDRKFGGGGPGDTA